MAVHPLFKYTYITLRACGASYGRAGGIAEMRLTVISNLANGQEDVLRKKSFIFGFCRHFSA
jgi:hypothetical protein